MNREEYLVLRNENRHTEILYNYAVERGFKYSLDEYKNFMMLWTQRMPVEVSNNIYTEVLVHYDVLFGVTTVQKVDLAKENHNGLEVDVERITILKII